MHRSKSIQKRAPSAQSEKGDRNLVTGTSHYGTDRKAPGALEGAPPAVALGRSQSDVPLQKSDPPSVESATARPGQWQADCPTIRESVSAQVLQRQSAQHDGTARQELEDEPAGESSENREQSGSGREGPVPQPATSLFSPDVVFFLETFQSKTAEETKQSLRERNVNPGRLATRLVRLRDKVRAGAEAAAVAGISSVEPGLRATITRLRAQLQNRADEFDQAVTFLRQWARADVSERVEDIIDGLDLSDDQKQILLDAIVFPYPRPDLSSEIIAELRDLGRADRLTLLGALESPGLSRDETDVAELEEEGGGYLEASPESVRAFREFFTDRIPDSLDLNADDVLRQSTDLASQNPDYEELPPPEIWSQMGPTLDLLGTLSELSGVTFEVGSAYRSELVNALAGGAGGSMHQTFAGLDVVPSQRRRFGIFVRYYWYERGAQHNMGLGYYGPHRQHIDSGIRPRRAAWEWDPWAEGEYERIQTLFQNEFNTTSLEDL